MELNKADITLRAFSEEDTEDLVLLCNNINIWRNVRDALPHPYKTADAKNFIQKANSKSPREIFAITKSGKLVGSIGIHPQEDVYRFSAEIGYWIGQPYWGKGIATYAVQLITQYGFDTLEMIKIYAGCFSFNQASQKVLLNAGFKEEAVLKKAVFKNGAFHDEIRYALFRDMEKDDNVKFAKSIIAGQL
ncbi:MAG: GNAT family N-acetyltransferase [Eudoraea sp.]|nr:GNAT family N-acetyltransferase [Eudoraea sp.]